MAATNRYTRRTIAPQFEPISFEQYAYAPMAWQEKEDDTMASALANQKQIKALSWHDAKARELEGQLEGEINQLVDNISEKGIIDMNTTRELANLQRRQKELFGEGSVGAQIENAYAARQAFAKELEGADGTEQWKREQLALYDKRSQDAFSGNQNINYNAALLNKDLNVGELAADALRKIPTSTIEQETGWRKTNDGRWVNTQTEETSRGTPTALQNYAIAYMQGDPEIMGYLQDRAMVQEELYGTKDEMGNIVYNNQSHNPEGFRRNLINETLIDESRHAVERAYKYDYSSGQDMRNMSASQQYGDIVNDALSNPIVRSIGFFNNSNYSDANMNAVLNPAQTITRKIVDTDGNTLSKEGLINTVRSYKQQNGFSRAGADNLSKVSDKELEDMVSQYYDLRTASIETKPEVTYNPAYVELQKFLSERDFKSTSLDRAEKIALQKEADAKLIPLMEQYNESLPEDYKVNTVDQFRNIYKDQLKSMGTQEVKTIDYNLPSNDLIMQDIKAGNLQSLRNKSLVIQNAEGEQVGSGEKALEKIESMLANNAKVSNGRRIMNGDYAGGRAIEVRDENGDTYTIQTEPLSENEAAMFVDDNVIFSAFDDPYFVGEGEPRLTPNPSNPSTMIQYTPFRGYENGVLSNKIITQVLDSKTGQPVSEARPYDMSNFYKMREAQRKPYYENMYKSDFLLRKQNPEQ